MIRSSSTQRRSVPWKRPAVPTAAAAPALSGRSARWPPSAAGPGHRRGGGPIRCRLLHRTSPRARGCARRRSAQRCRSRRSTVRPISRPGRSTRALDVWRSRWGDEGWGCPMGVSCRGGTTARRPHQIAGPSQDRLPQGYAESDRTTLNPHSQQANNKEPLSRLRPIQEWPCSAEDCRAGPFTRPVGQDSGLTH